MKKIVRLSVYVLILLLFAAIILGGATWLYRHSETFKSLFGPHQAAVLGSADPEHSLAATTEVASLFSLYIFSGIIVVQFFTLFTAVWVLGGIKRAAESAEIKLKRLSNADIFLDLPLYVGLFGSVASFMVMTFSPSSSQLIAYSSTLIGIIFSTIMRIGLLYPQRAQLLSEVSDRSLEESVR